MPDSGASGSTTSGGVRESTLLWPMLSRTNYSEWSMLMQCNYEAMEIWEAIDPRGLAQSSWKDEINSIRY